MAIKPILFNTEMVKAILDGRKTQTRRVIKPAALGFEYEDGNPARLPPYQPKDVLWVRETFSVWHTPDLRRNYLYKADFQGDSSKVKWRPSIHMPKEAARLFLRVTGVGVERLQDIDANGIRAEGLTSACAFWGGYGDSGAGIFSALERNNQTRRPRQIRLGIKSLGVRDFV